MTEENWKMIQHRVLERVQEEIIFALEHEPADAENETESEAWEQLHYVSGLIDEVIEDYRQREKVYKVGWYYLDEDSGMYLKCVKKTDNSVWFDECDRNGTGRIEIIGKGREEETRRTYRTKA